MQGLAPLDPTHCACLERMENNVELRVLTHPDSARAVRAGSPTRGRQLGGSTLATQRRPFWRVCSKTFSCAGQ